MPVEEVQKMTGSRHLPDVRKIKIGANTTSAGGKKIPNKLSSPVITGTVKEKGGENFMVDIETMNKIRAALGIPLPDKDNVQHPMSIPCMLTSDDVKKFLHTYRGIYNSSQEIMCKSDIGDPNAKRYWVDSKAEADTLGKSRPVKHFFILDNPKIIPCTTECKFWKIKKDEGERAQCTWHGKLSVQLQQLKVLPRMAVFRTSAWTVLCGLYASLNRLSDMTGGILENIPLMLTMVNVSGRDQHGKTRSWSLLIFEYAGSSLQLREHVIQELDGRSRLLAARVRAGLAKEDDSIRSLPSADVLDRDGEGSDEDGAPIQVDLDEYIAPLDDSAEMNPEDLEREVAAVQQAIQVSESQMHALREQVGISDREFDLLAQKHHGNMEGIIAELKARAGNRVAPVVTPAQAAPTVPPSFEEMESMSQGAPSGESSETLAAAEPEAPAAAEPVQPEAAPAAKPADAFQAWTEPADDLDWNA